LRSAHGWRSQQLRRPIRHGDEFRASKSDNQAPRWPGPFELRISWEPRSWTGRNSNPYGVVTRGMVHPADSPAAAAQTPACGVHPHAPQQDRSFARVFARQDVSPLGTEERMVTGHRVPRSARP
jgi:hypothetical protein